MCCLFERERGGGRRLAVILRFFLPFDSSNSHSGWWLGK